MEEVLHEGFLRQEFNPEDVKCATTKFIYRCRIADVVPPSKIVEKHPGVDFRGLVFPRLSYRILQSKPKYVLFSLVHNFYSTKQRMFMQNRTQDPHCPLQECQGMVQDREHLFTSCSLVASAWLWLRSRLLGLLCATVGAVGISNEDFLLLQFPKDTLDQKCVWLIENYCEIVNKCVVGKKTKLQPDQLAGRLRSRLLMMKGRAVVQPVLLVL